MNIIEPINDVITPIGSSAGLITTLLTKSVTITNVAPKIIERGRRRL